MSLPKPVVSLDGACSVVHDGVLYVFSPAGFQSIELTPGAQWERLEDGVAVTKGVCVSVDAGSDEQNGLYIVGGTSDSSEYQGLQKYSYRSRKWESIEWGPEGVTESVLRQRQWHASAYIKATNKLLVYSGTQDNVLTDSSQTFTIDLSPPYVVHSFDSAAPPAILPTLVRWSDSEVAMVGGSIGNKNVMIFDSVAWRDSGASLADPIPKDSVRAALVTADDTSKTLLTFDMTLSPPLVTRIVLVDDLGRSLSQSPTLVGRSIAPRQSTDGRLRLSDWPEYDSKNAPATTRSDYSMARNGNQFVFVGGSVEEPVVVFNAADNSWVDPDDVFVDQKRFTETNESSTATATSATSTTSATTSITTSFSSLATDAASTQTTTLPDATSSPVPTESGTSDDSGLSVGTFIGISIGGVGFALLLIILVVVYLRRRAKRFARPTTPDNEAETTSSLEKGSMPHVPWTEAERLQTLHTISALDGPTKLIPGYPYSQSADSLSSVAILTGGATNSPHIMAKKQLATSPRTRSPTFSAKMLRKISRPVLQTVPPSVAVQTASPQNTVPPGTPPPRPPRPSSSNTNSTTEGERRTSGWNRYWSRGSTPSTVGFGKRNSDTSSRYSDLQSPTTTRERGNVGLSGLRTETRPSLNRVPSGSPTISFANRNRHVPEAHAVSIERSISEASSRSAVSTEQNASAWDPTLPSGRAVPPSAGRGNPIPQPARPREHVAPARSTDMSWINIEG